MNRQKLKNSVDYEISEDSGVSVNSGISEDSEFCSFLRVCALVGTLILPNALYCHVLAYIEYYNGIPLV